MQATTRTTTEKRGPKRWLMLLLVPAAALALGACANTGGISQDDATAIREQIEEVANRLDAVEERLMEVSEQNDTEVLISDVRDVSSDVAEAKGMLEDVSAKLAVAELADDGTLDAPLNDPLNDPLNSPMDTPLDTPASTDPLGDDGNLDNDLNNDLDNDALNGNDLNGDDGLGDDGLGDEMDDDLDSSDPLNSSPLDDPLVPSQDEQAPGL